MRIDHVAMYVNDIEKARDFFVKYLDGKSNAGYHNVKTDFRSYFISFDDGSRLEIMNRPDMTDEEKVLNRTGLIHIAFSVGSKERVDELTGRLKSAGFDIVSGPRTTGDGYYESCIIAIEGSFDIVSGPRTTGDGYYESCIIAIEGNQIEITI